MNMEEVRLNRAGGTARRDSGKRGDRNSGLIILEIGELILVHNPAVSVCLALNLVLIHARSLG